ncbi:hypothetical protein EJ04DRAFT_502843 [Polyplosphaeria fusca]|uniref:Rhodopsin domain-containing protein n=1 Tax=Polyplosphaeria fusca TaxID=682080 RepID=A0A9P4QQP5_9PLEO|nr:hypothetical protein EJ04DRAFT_502843 [Polyplosphaeria fusca]
MTIGGRGVQTAIVTSLFAALGTLFVALRLWTRFVVIRAPGWEDWVLITSWFFATATVITIGIQIPNGLGEHGKELDLKQVQMLLLNLYLSIIMYCASLGLTKLAILMQYRRVFTSPRFQIVCWTVIAIIIAYTVATVTVAIFTCTPISTFWTNDSSGKCIDDFASWFSNAGINIATDIIIIALPMPVIRRLRLAKRQKWLLMGVFALGGVVCIISIVRLHSLFIISKSLDPTYDNSPAATFSVIEVNVALICACLPTLRPLLSEWIPGLQMSSRGTAGASAQQSYGRKKSSGLGFSGSLPLHSLSGSQGGARKLEDYGPDKESDGIHVVTKIDVMVQHKEAVLDGRESSTDSLFRDTGRIV